MPLPRLLPNSLMLLACTIVYGCPAGHESNDSVLSTADGGSSLGSAEASSLPISRPDETFSLNHVEHKDECSKTGEDRCKACEADQRASVSDCWNTCYDAQSAGIFQDCASICGDLDRPDRCDYACGETDENTCWERAYAFTVVGKPDGDIERACEEAVERNSDCDEVNVGTACSVYAKVEKPATVAVYECVAAAACGEPVEHCFEPLGESDFSKEVAGTCEQEALSEDLRSRLDMLGAWLRSTALDDVAICERLCGTGDYEECVELWFWAVVGQ